MSRRVIVGHSSQDDFALTFIDDSNTVGQTWHLGRSAALWIHEELGRQLGRADLARTYEESADRNYETVIERDRTIAALKGVITKLRRRRRRTP